MLQSIRSSKLELPGLNATKTCKVCKQTKPVELFGRNGTWRRPECLSCYSRQMATYQRLRKKQQAPPLGTPCECCGSTEQKLHWDHCHETHEHRGWICNNCNTGIGKLGDNIEGVIKALDYLGRVNKLKAHQGGDDDLATA